MRALAGILGLALVACGGDRPGAAGPGDHHLKTVVSALSLGSPPGEFAIDLDGDGEEDDALGSIAASLLSTSNIDLQGDLDDAIADGETLLLIEVISHDESFENDSEALVIVQHATTTANPNFTGQGAFAIDTQFPSFTTQGAIIGGVFRSYTEAGVPRPLAFSASFDGEIFEVPIIDVLVQATVDPEQHKLVAGKLTGAMVESEFTGVVLPILAASYNAQIDAAPTANSTLQILNLFDTGGCPGATADNSNIELCELETNFFLGVVLAPDVDILDGNGNVSPKPNGPKDALSLGVGFTAVGATY